MNRSSCWLRVPAYEEDYKKRASPVVLSSSYVLLITQTPVSPTTSRAMKIPERTSFLDLSAPVRFRLISV